MKFAGTKKQLKASLKQMGAKWRRQLREVKVTERRIHALQEAIWKLKNKDK